MNRIGLEYGKWLSSFDWNLVATIRRHYPLTEFNTNNMMQGLIKQKSVDRLFYAIEPDKQDNMTHAHLLIHTNKQYNREKLANALGINKKAVSFMDKIEDADAVCYYCTKHINSRFSFHDILIKMN